jgi:hypothetical protein
MNRYKVVLYISAVCEADAIELIEDYTGEETDLDIKSIEEVK